MIRVGELLLVSSVVMVGVMSAIAPIADVNGDGVDGEYGQIVHEVSSLRKEKESLLSEIERLSELNENLKSSNMIHERNSVSRAYENGTEWKPVDCADLLLSGETQSGVYEIYPFSCGCESPVTVYCDMETDGGGWTVILNRENQVQQLDFNRTWDEYKAGFGNLAAEHWMGNENLHLLTNGRSYALRMDLQTPGGEEKFIHYQNVRVEKESSYYRLELGSRSAESTIPNDCYNYNRNRYFSTYDQDHDSSSSKNCASLGGGGFWFSSYCHIKYPPTGIYESSYMNSSCYYNTIDEAVTLQMKLRPSACDATAKIISLPGHGCSGDCNSPVALPHQ